MDELQCDDFYVPAFLLNLPLMKGSNGGNEIEEDFLKDIEAWSGCSLEEDYDE